MEIKRDQWYIIRSKEAGAFFAHIDAKRGDEVDLSDARRLWYWDGAASLSQMAVDGVSNPLDCKFTVIVPSMTVMGVCEIIPCTDKAVESIQRVQEAQEATAVLEEILRARIGSQGPNERKILSMPLRLMDTVQQMNSVMVAVAEYEKKQPGKQATPYGLEMAESIHALLDHIEETVHLLREKYPEMKERAQ